jgi:hypothetical protein
MTLEVIFFFAILVLSRVLGIVNFAVNGFRIPEFHLIFISGFKNEIIN